MNDTAVLMVIWAVGASIWGIVGQVQVAALRREKLALRTRLRGLEEAALLASKSGEGERTRMADDLERVHKELDRADTARQEKQVVGRYDPDGWVDAEEGSVGKGPNAGFTYREKSAADRIRSVVWKCMELEKDLARIREVVDAAKVATTFEHSETWANGEVKRCVLPLDLPYRVKRLIEPDFKPHVFVSWGP